MIVNHINYNNTHRTKRKITVVATTSTSNNGDNTNDPKDKPFFLFIATIKSFVMPNRLLKFIATNETNKEQRIEKDKRIR